MGELTHVNIGNLFIHGQDSVVSNATSFNLSSIRYKGENKL